MADQGGAVAPRLRQSLEASTRELLVDGFGKQLGNLLADGPVSASGVNLSTRTGFGQMLLPLSGTDPKDLVRSTITQMGGRASASPTSS